MNHVLLLKQNLVAIINSKANLKTLIKIDMNILCLKPFFNSFEKAIFFKKTSVLALFFLVSTQIYAQESQEDSLIVNPEEIENDFNSKETKGNDFTNQINEYFQSFDEKKENDGYRTIFNSLKFDRISGFGGPTFSITMIDGDLTAMTGGYGGVILGQLLIGAYSESTNYRAPYSQNDPSTFEHGGLYLGYEMMHKNVIHPVFSLKVGEGQIIAYSQEYDGKVRDHVFSIAPSVAAEINFTRFFKVNCGVEYRIVPSVSSAINQNFSGPSVNLGFVFGWF